MTNLNVALGKAKWAQAEYLSARANAFRVASDAADAIEAADQANEWRNTAAELQGQSVHLFSEAKALGYYGDKR